MTTKITVRIAICFLMFIFVVSFSTCANSKGKLSKNNNEEIKKGNEFLIKEAKVEAKYIRDICKRANWIYDANKYRSEGGDYSWYVYLPMNNEEAPPGICVYISPRGGSYANADRWKDIMNKRNLIYIASRDSSNSVPTENRMALTLRAIDIVREKYKFNNERIYVCGDSGGGRISSMVAPLYPEIIKGAIYSIGCNFWDTITTKGNDNGPGFLAHDLNTKKGNDYWPGFLAHDLNPKVDLLNIKKNRFVFLTGDFDANMEQTKANYNAYLESGIKNCAYILVKNMGHASPALKYWQVAFAYLDGKDLKEAIKESESMLTISLKEDSGNKVN